MINKYLNLKKVHRYMKILCKEFMFKELVNTLSSYLQKKKYQVVLTDKIKNEDDELYIIIGYDISHIIQLPKQYILFQVDYQPITEQYINIMKNAIAIWNVSINDIERFDKSLCLPFYNVPLQYSSIMDSNIQLNENLKDIDILVNIPIEKIERRESIIKKLQSKYNVYISKHGLLTSEKKKLFLRSKIILHILDNENEYINTIDYWYFLNNRGFIISETTTKDSQLLDNYIVCCKYENLIEQCDLYLHNTNERHKKNNELFTNWKKTSFEIPISTLLNEKRKKKPISGTIDYYIPTSIKSVEIEKNKNTGQITLKLPYVKDSELPYISIITPTKDRKFIFNIAIYNFLHFNYPPEKMEWIILNNGDDDLQDILPTDNRIKYMSVPSNKYTLGELRNKCIEYSTNEYIVYMDDDDYYDKDSIRSRIISLLKYKSEGIECVGCERVPFFNLINGENMTGSNKKNYLCEASMAHTKNFWRERPFHNDKIAEYKYFLLYRQHKILHIPYEFVMIAINHNVNTTGLSRFKKKELDETWKQSDFSKLYFQYFNKDVQNILLESIKNRTIEHYSEKDSNKKKND